jgi:hypothetical protein
MPYMFDLVAGDLYKFEIDAVGDAVDGLTMPDISAQVLATVLPVGGGTAKPVDDWINIGTAFTKMEFLSAADNKDSENLIYIKLTAANAAAGQLVVEFPTGGIEYSGAADYWFLPALGSMTGLGGLVTAPTSGTTAFCQYYNNNDAIETTNPTDCKLHEGFTGAGYLEYPYNTQIIFDLGVAIAANDVITVGIAIKNEN